MSFQTYILKMQVDAYCRSCGTKNTCDCGEEGSTQPWQACDMVNQPMMRDWNCSSCGLFIGWDDTSMAR